MKHVKQSLSALLIFAAPGDAAYAERELVHLFVAPDGNDAFSGDRREADGAGHGPFRTPQRALDAMRAARTKQAGLSVEIDFAPGLYELERPLTLGPGDSGTAEAPVRFVGAAHAVLSGGRRIDGFRAAPWNGMPAFVADLPQARPQARNAAWRFREIFVDGVRRTRARHPDRGCLTVTGIEPADAGKEWSSGVAAFRAAAVDCAPLADAPGAEVVLMSRWVESHCRVAAVAAVAAATEPSDAGATRTVRLLDTTVFKLDPGDLWYAEGSPGFLDAPGEWWLDEEQGRLWVLALPGEELTHAEVIAPRLERLLSFEGRPSDGAFVDHFEFSDLEFAHAEWWFAPSATSEGARPSGFPQAAFGVPAAIEAVGARDVSFKNCTIAHAGTYGVSFGAGCRGDVLEGCRLADLGAGGVKIGETALRESEPEQCRENRVEECELHDLGRIFHSTVGIWIGQSPGNTLQHNEIHDLYYTGISIGWTWGYGPANAGGNLVRGNHVHHVGARADGDGPLLSDMGGIYTLGSQPGTRIEGNWFHDVAARRYGGWGIYFDEGSTGLVAEKNLVTRTTHGGFHQHYGKENVVTRNVFAWGRDAQVQRTRCEPHTSFHFTHNVVLADRGELFAGDLSDGHFEFKDNLYWRTDGQELRFAGRSFAEWQATGQDATSRIADPGFAALADDDFGTGPDTVAFAILEGDWFGADSSFARWRQER